MWGWKGVPTEGYGWSVHGARLGEVQGNQSFQGEVGLVMGNCNTLGCLQNLMKPVRIFLHSQLLRTMHQPCWEKTPSLNHQRSLTSLLLESTGMSLFPISHGCVAVLLWAEHPPAPHISLPGGNSIAQKLLKTAKLGRLNLEILKSPSLCFFTACSSSRNGPHLDLGT